MGRAVERSGDARIGAKDMDRQLGIADAQERLVKYAAGSEDTEGVHESGEAAGRKTGSDADSVRLGDTGIEGALRISLQELSGVDAVHQVTIHMDDLLVFRHEFEHGLYITIAVRALVFLVFSD